MSRAGTRAPEPPATYDAVSVALHWTIAVLVLANLLLAWRFEGLDGAARGALIRIHKSAGITVLLLSLLRPLWRALHPAPRPAGSSDLERRLAKAVHCSLYALLVAMPLSGWMMVSADSAQRPTRVWGLAALPRLEFLAALPPPLREQVHGLLAGLHLALALALTALVAIHVAGALKHHFAASEGGLERMLPWLRPPSSTS
jgi:cytochrome b561